MPWADEGAEQRAKLVIEHYYGRSITPTKSEPKVADILRDLATLVVRMGLDWDLITTTARQRAMGLVQECDLRREIRGEPIVLLKRKEV